MADNLNGIWTTTVDEIIAIFREGLRALLPTMRRARIRYTEPDAYDDWDRIASALYASIVEDALKNAVPQRAIRIAPYDLHVPSYADLSYIRHKQDAGLVFHSLDPEDTFESVRFIHVLENGAPESTALVTASADNLVEACLRTEQNTMVVVSELRVEL